MKLSLSCKEKRLSVIENRELRRIFGLQGEKVLADWRKMHNEELHNLNFSPNLYGVIKSRRM
jgi:hypothetical protein